MYHSSYTLLCDAFTGQSISSKQACTSLSTTPCGRPPSGSVSRIILILNTRNFKIKTRVNVQISNILNKKIFNVNLTTQNRSTHILKNRSTNILNLTHIYREFTFHSVNLNENYTIIQIDNVKKFRFFSDMVSEKLIGS